MKSQHQQDSTNMMEMKQSANHYATLDIKKNSEKIDNDNDDDNDNNNEVTIINMKKGAEPAPSIIVSHLYIDTSFINLVKNILHKSLVLFIYRDETNCLMSAIRHVMVSKACKNKLGLNISTQNNGLCWVMNEKYLIQKVIKPKAAEIGNGAIRIMMYRLYDAMEKYYLQMVFVHYK